MEGDVLSRQDARVADARVLRAAAHDGGGELHVLPHAEREGRGGMGPGDTGGFHVRAQGAAAHYAHRPAQGRGRPAALLPRDRPDARAEARAHPVPAAPQLQEGPRAPQRPAHAVPRRSALRLGRSEEHTSELQSPCNLVCRLLLEKKKKYTIISMM